MAIKQRTGRILGTLTAVVIVAAALPETTHAQNRSETANAQNQTASGQLTEQSLGSLIAAMGLRPKKMKKRYDFRFKAIMKGEEWELSMSAVLSQNGKSIWVMAWLDELPKSAADVPRTALLRLLANNDRLGQGKFFAYIASNRRFVLQRVVLNKNVSIAMFRDVLKDLGATVVVTYPHWSVANWKRSSSVNSSKTATGPTATTRTTSRESKFQQPRRN